MLGRGAQPGPKVGHRDQQPGPGQNWQACLPQRPAALVKHWSKTGQKLVKNWSNTDGEGVLLRGLPPGDKLREPLPANQGERH